MRVLGGVKNGYRYSLVDVTKSGRNYRRPAKLYPKSQLQNTARSCYERIWSKCKIK